MKTIALTKGLVAIVDDEDYEWLNQYKWHCHNGHRGLKYAARTVRKKCILMHRVVMDAPAGKGVDHINNDTLDNRRSNLRFATQLENLGNQRKTSKPRASQFKGVTWHKAGQKWMAYIGERGKLKYLGLHETEEAAARAYDVAALAKWGDFARLNFPHE